MQPKSSPPSTDLHLFQSQLSAILHPKHPLIRLGEAIDWAQIDEAVEPLYTSDFGRPGCSTRVMVGLHFLKYAFDESDESVVERWVENPYWQSFCGEQYMQHKLPIDPSSMTRWRNRVGDDLFEKLLSLTINAAKAYGLVKANDLNQVNVDTTVQEKAIAFPTDARLYHKARRTLVREAKWRGIQLRQSCLRVGKRALFKQGRYAHAKQFKRARKQTKKLKTYLGRVVRDIERKAGNQMDERLQTLLARGHRLLEQERKSKHKLYSFHAPEVVCISKGKAHKRYEFGCKVGIATSSRGNWALSALVLEGNPYDGHTLQATVGQVRRVTGLEPKVLSVDKGYRGHDYQGAAEVHIAGKKAKTRRLKRLLKRRNAIEPCIGHMKHDDRMDRNHLKGAQGDKINALSAAIGFNFRKLLKGILLRLYWLQLRRTITSPWSTAIGHAV